MCVCIELKYNGLQEYTPRNTHASTTLIRMHVDVDVHMHGIHVRGSFVPVLSVPHITRENREMGIDNT